MVKVHPTSDAATRADGGAAGTSQTGTPFRVLNETRGSPLHHLKERIQCFFEGGRRMCRHCSAGAAKRNTRRNGSCAIDGLNSNWVVRGQIIAMARPSERALAEGLLAGLRASKVCAIINLQETGEHAHCGPGILKRSGLSYLPETVMAHGIHHYHLAWRDMAAPRVEMAADIVKIMHQFTCRGAVAVHCHAGLGRTGLIIACYLIFYHCMGAADAIAEVRRHRKGSIQNRLQEAFTVAFAEAIRGARFLMELPACRNMDSRVNGGEPRGSSRVRMLSLIAKQRLLHAGESFSRYYWTLECVDSIIAAIAAKELLQDANGFIMDGMDALFIGAGDDYGFPMEFARAVNGGCLTTKGAERFDTNTLLAFLRRLFVGCERLLPDDVSGELASIPEKDGFHSNDDDARLSASIAASLIRGARVDQAPTCPQRATVIGIMSACVAATSSLSINQVQPLLTLVSKLLVLNLSASSPPQQGPGSATAADAGDAASRRVHLLRDALKTVVEDIHTLRL